jgi:hypothetical protein
MMAYGSKITVLSLTSVAAAALLAGGCLADERKPYAEKDEVQPRSGLAPCSARLALVRAPRLAPSDAAEDLVEEAFDAQRLLGVEENVEILSGDGGEGGFLRVRYPEDSVNFGSADDETPLGGAAFYAPFAKTKASCLHYRVRFPTDFEFAKGGKLPGLYAGEAPSGGEKVSGKDGWSIRLMWREDGEGELYEYVFNKKGKYGLSAGRGAFTFPRGRWVEVDLEVVVNDPDERNGKARLWIDGRPVIEQEDLVYSTEDDGPLEGGLMFSTFFGGSSDSWASPKDQHVDFADFRLHAGEDVR